MAPITLLYIIFVSKFVTLNVATTPKFCAIFIFGDSLLDTGNNNFIPTPFQANHYPYGRDFPGGIATGRFTNGLMISDLIASSLGIKNLVPPFLDPRLSNDDISTGVCFASAGAGYDDTTNADFYIIPVSYQVGLLKLYLTKLRGIVGEEEAKRILNESLAVVSSGSNDIGTRSSFVNIQGYNGFLLQRVQGFVKEIYDLGVRNVLLAGLPPLGCFPDATGVTGSCSEIINYECKIYNHNLQWLLPQLQSSLPGSKLIYADMYTPIKKLANNPQKYGLVVTNRGCCGSGLTEVGPSCSPMTLTCPNSSQFLFFDAVHFTETAYRYITRYWVANSLPQFY